MVQDTLLDSFRAYLKAGETYHVSIKYQNTGDKTITDTSNVETGGGVKVGNDLHVSVSNYKVDMVHF